MVERCYVMVKPGFTDPNLIKEVIDVLESKGVKLMDYAYVNYDEECAKLHYTEKSGKSFFRELVDYIKSDKAFGMVFEGADALCLCRNTVEELRKTLPVKYGLSTDVMHNILHCSSKTKVGDTFLELDTQREIALFKYLKYQQI